MMMAQPIACISSILLGYLIGSISPAYFFGRLKHIDIREHGRRHAGALNVYHTIGLMPAIPTAIIDALKGILAILLAQTLGVNFFCAQLSGFAAIVGHVLPFYLGFRGGQGVACATGILILYITRYNIGDPFFFNTIGLSLILVAIFFYITKTGEIVGLVVLPLLAYSFTSHEPSNPSNIFLCITAAYINAVGVFNIVTRKLLTIRDETFIAHWWRTAFRPGALVLIIFYLNRTQRDTLVFIGCVALFFIVFDIIRFVHRQTNELFTRHIKTFFRKGEYRRFSSMTIFLFAGFITFLVFNKEIAIAAFIFLIFGDIFSKIFGLGFGRHKIFEKTFEGSLAYLGGALICAYLIHMTLGISFFILALGALAAAIAEIMPLGLDDNFTVAIFSGAVMTVAKIFGS